MCCCCVCVRGVGAFAGEGTLVVVMGLFFALNDGSKRGSRSVGEVGTCVSCMSVSTSR